MVGKFLSSLQFRLILVVVLLVLGSLWGFAWLVADRQESRLRALLAVEQAASLKYIADSVDSVIRLRLDALDNTRASIPLAQLNDRAALTETLRNRPVLRDLYNSGIVIVRPDGVGAFADYPPLPGRSEVNFSGLDAFQNALFEGRATMGKPFRSRFLDKPVVSFGTPIYAAGGEVAAVLLGITTLDAPNFLDLVGRERPAAGGDLLVVAPHHGIFVTGSDPSFMLKPMPSADEHPLVAKVRDGFEGTVVTASPDDGIERLMSVRRVPAADWVVVSRLPAKQAFAPVRETRNFVFTGAAALSGLIGLLAAFFIRRALAPLGDAAVRLDAISQGRAALSRLPVARSDEVGNLIESFNRLQARLAAETAALQASQARLTLAASVFANTHEGVTITDTEGTILDVNPAFCDITGYGREEVLGKNPRILKSGRQDRQFYEAMWASIAGHGFWRGEIWNRRKDGETYPALLTISVVRDERGAISNYVSVFADISQLKQHEWQLERMAHFDALTGIPNRVLLADRMHQTMAQTLRSGALMAVGYLDLDNFKPVNDTYGHEAGDRLLVEVTQRLKACLRGGDTIARLGGDEFVLLLAGLSQIGECELVLDRVVTALTVPCNIGGATVKVSASIGITFYPFDDADADTLLRHADQAMYIAKQSGRNRYHLFDAEHDRRARAHHESIGRIEAGLRQQEFVLFYQPKVDMRQGRVVGAEALIRWQHPERGLLSPGEFLPPIEDADLIVDVGNWVIDTVLAQMKAWRAVGLDLAVSVNIAARHLQRKDFLLRLQKMVDAHGGPAVAGRLELEVLETAAVEDTGRVSRLIEICRGLGISFAIDDFGTGYSSLTYFKALPADTLKIDQSFIRDMLRDPDDLAIVEGVIGLTEVFRRQVVAEGVETVEHGIALLGLGCDLAQGYGIARPMPADAMPEWVRDWRPDPAWAQVGRIRWPREDLHLLVAENEHRRWVGDVSARIAGVGGGEPPPAGPHDCTFGHWYDTTGRSRYGGLPEFTAIAPIHERIHAVGVEAMALREAERATAARELLPELFQLRDQLIGRLRALQSTVRPPQSREG